MSKNIRNTKTIPERIVDEYCAPSFEKYKDLPMKELELLCYMAGCGAYAKDYNMSETEFVKDMVGSMLTAFDWREHKQIYRFSDELYQDICNMEDAEIPKDAFAPSFPCIYIDLSGQSDTLLGVMLDYKKRIATSDGIPRDILILIRVLKTTTDTQWNLLYSQTDFGDTVNATIQEMHQKDPRLPYDEIMAILRMALYLSSSKPDIERRNPPNLSIRRSPKALREIEDSVKEWDVGVRYAVERKSSMAKQPESQGQKASPDDVSPHTDSVRKRPRAHIRKAHWHLYWTGEGRKIPKVLFLPPTFVNAGASGMPVTIRMEEK